MQPLFDYYEIADHPRVKNARVYDLASSVKASKYPMAINADDMTKEIVERTRKLGSSKKGEGHDQFLSGIVVSFDLTFSNKAWVHPIHNFISKRGTVSWFPW